MNDVQKNFRKQINSGLKDLKKKDKATYYEYVKQNHLDDAQSRITGEKRNKAINMITAPFKIVFKLFAGLIVIAVVFSLIKTMGNNSVSANNINLADFKKAATVIDYDSLARNAKAMIGKKVYLKGTVVQAIDNSKEIRLNMAAKDKFGNQTASQTIFIQRKDNTGVLLNSDEIELWGIVSGYVNETLVTGQKITEPQITSYYLNITKKEGSK